MARWTAAGARVKGHKVGLTSAAMQRQINVDQPDYGHLLDRMFWPEAEPIPPPFFLQPRVEPETAFVLAKPLRGPGVTVADAIAAVGFVLPALELIDSALRSLTAGTGTSGSPCPTWWRTTRPRAASSPVPWPRHPVAGPRARGVRAGLNGQVVDSATGAAVQGHPAEALALAANDLGGAAWPSRRAGSCSPEA